MTLRCNRHPGFARISQIALCGRAITDRHAARPCRTGTGSTWKDCGSYWEATPISSLDLDPRDIYASLISHI